MRGKMQMRLGFAGAVHTRGSREMMAERRRTGIPQAAPPPRPRVQTTAGSSARRRIRAPPAAWKGIPFLPVVEGMEWVEEGGCGASRRRRDWR